MYSWLCDWQSESAPEQEAALAGSSYDNAPFDKKRKPGRGNFGGVSSIEVLEMFRPIMTIQERVFQKMFTTTKLFTEPKESMWLPTFRTLMIGWRERTHYRVGSPEFTKDEEISANNQIELVITEIPINKGDSKPRLTETDTSAVEPANEVSNTGQKPESRKRKHYDEPPHEDELFHNCEGNSCELCNNEPCYCIDCQDKALMERINWDGSLPKKPKQEEPSVLSLSSIEQLTSSNQVFFRHHGIFSLMRAKEVTGQHLTTHNLVAYSQHLMKHSISDGGVLYLKAEVILHHTKILGILPNGVLVITSDKNTRKKSSLSVLLSQRLKHWKTIELSIPEDWSATIGFHSLDSNHFLLTNMNKTFILSQKANTWVINELGLFKKFNTLSDGRFITTEGTFGQADDPTIIQIWAEHNGVFIPTPIGYTKHSHSLISQNRIAASLGYGEYKIWTEDNGEWKVSSLQDESDRFETWLTKFIQFNKDLLISHSLSTVGVWRLQGTQWYYEELLNNSRNIKKIFKICKRQFASWQNFKGNSIKIWSLRDDNWHYEELNHLHKREIKTVITFGQNRFITHSYDSTRVWTCQNDACVASELTAGYNGKIDRVNVLSDDRVVTVNSDGSLYLWYEGAQWSYVPLVMKDAWGLEDKLLELPEGYLIAACCQSDMTYGDTDDAGIWNLFPRPPTRSTEHLERVETDNTVQYLQYGRHFNDIDVVSLFDW